MKSKPLRFRKLKLEPLHKMSQAEVKKQNDKHFKELIKKGRIHHDILMQLASLMDLPKKIPARQLRKFQKIVRSVRGSAKRI